jgi:SAM-dependent methyltransferase
VYGKIFYRSRRSWTAQAAQAALPLILDLTRPRSLADIGCGTGIWLREASRLGVGRIHGIDGPWVSEELLEIPPADFRRADLSAPIRLEEPVDVVMSLEVAEHLPADKAPLFVTNICQMAPVVVFSAAIPGQGGQHHVNEQWPSYWVDLFTAQGFQAYDVLRPALWQDAKIPYWYRQNLMIFASDSAPAEVLARLRQQAATVGSFGGADLVHPEHSLRALQFPSLSPLLRAVPFAFVRSLSNLADGLRGLPAAVGEVVRGGHSIRSILRRRELIVVLPILLLLVLSVAGAVALQRKNNAASTSLEELLQSTIVVDGNSGAVRIVIAEEAILAGMPSDSSTLLAASESDPLVLANLVDDDQGDHYIVALERVALFEELMAVAKVVRVGGNEHFAVFREAVDRIPSS